MKIGNTVKIGISSGDLNGIGLEILYKALNFYFNKISKNLLFFLFVNPKSLITYLTKMGFRYRFKKPDEIYLGEELVKLVPLIHEPKINFGQISSETGIHSIESIKKAVEWARENKVDGIVTLPINKKAVAIAGLPFPGHTEFIANLCGCKTPLMLFVYRKIRVALLTIHIPLIEVSKRISINFLSETIKIFANSLKKDFLINSPNIALLGLNPHCGETGIMGREEETIIIPTIKELNQSGYNLFGPFPSDSFFGNELHRQFDGILAMYHDQGLIPFKLISKMAGVNFTANLPIVRTSPDHGTGFDIAGLNKASPSSLIKSIKLAESIVKNRKKQYSFEHT
ncbi:MAG: 4-hydroxythreonine-4-phosphate dehydrogenase PdxA [Candidatus Kapaibacteriales bacterium]